MVIKDSGQLEKVFRQAKATAEIEGHVFTPEDDKDIKAVLTGRITRQELIEKLIKEESYE